MPKKPVITPRKAPVYLWTGLGWGKTTSSLGVALRAIGHGYKVVIIQFMKGWGERVGEVKIAEKLKPLYEIYQFGRPGWINLEKPAPIDKQMAQKGLAFARKKAKEKPFLLILDEINLAVAAGMLDEKEVLHFLDEVPPEVHVYLTGRYATPKLMMRADFVNEIVMIKGQKKLKGEEGIDY